MTILTTCSRDGSTADAASATVTDASRIGTTSATLPHANSEEFEWWSGVIDMVKSPMIEHYPWRFLRLFALNVERHDIPVLDIFGEPASFVGQRDSNREWAEELGLAPWTVSRGFKQVFGISPEAFRARTRARQAWKVIHTTKEPLAQVALRLGFADQPHMTCSVKQITGMPPHAWRVAANRFKTARSSHVKT